MAKYFSVLLIVSALVSFTVNFEVSAAQKPEPALLSSVLANQTGCNNFVQFDSNHLFLGSGQYKYGVEEPRSPIPGNLRLAPLNGETPVDLATLDAPVDMVTDGGHALVLTYSGLEDWDLARRARVATFPTFYYAQTMKYKQHALGMARFADKLLIAHGRLGLSVFDIRNRRITKQIPLLQEQAPLESMAVDVAVVGNYAYVLVDSFSLVPADQKQPFRGILVFDLKSESVVAAFDGLDQGADHLIADEKSLIVSFIGMPVLKFALADFQKSSATVFPEVKQEVRQFPVKGHPIGKFAMDAENIYACYLNAPTTPGSGGWYKRATATLNRKVLILD